MGFFSWLKSKFATHQTGLATEFIEVEHARPEPKVMIRTFQLYSFDDTKTILAAMREGRTVILVDLGPLREKDVVDLKRAVNKLRNACMELGADIASLGGDWIIIAPGFAEIYRPQLAPPQAPQEQPQQPQAY